MRLTYSLTKKSCENPNHLFAKLLRTVNRFKCHAKSALVLWIIRLHETVAVRFQDIDRYFPPFSPEYHQRGALAPKVSVKTTCERFAINRLEVMKQRTVNFVRKFCVKRFSDLKRQQGSSTTVCAYLALRNCEHQLADVIVGGSWNISTPLLLNHYNGTTTHRCVYGAVVFEPIAFSKS